MNWRRKSKAKAALRLAVYTRDGFSCIRCGWAPPVPDGYDGTEALGERTTRINAFGEEYEGSYKFLELDHIHPQSLGGAHTVDNLQAMCGPCNAAKGGRI